MSEVQIMRYLITCTWLYQGIFPKLVHIAPLEWLISGSLGFDDATTVLFIKISGILECLWALVFFKLYQYLQVLWLNILALVGLFAAVVILQPSLLIEAFNPVTTNALLIGMTLVLMRSLAKSNQLKQV
ncbi:hypothetical protein FLL45_01995 [Aliikangiella marina]|uniref:DoxX-like family protein n=1 Tax=Aliikangiella marina TaxID=1712262 RepID=A0A545THR5_9GAMM|nr:DoxX-like family protein [Aliikangiella marina]TQV76752.1 hypothetical protein FLL45_01995 [Aliikangiella marina]